jgi:hypothetical protein
MRTNHGGRSLIEQNVINPDVICQQAILAKLNVKQAKEGFEAVLKTYNDQVDNLVNLVNLMKARILELEAQVRTPAGVAIPAAPGKTGEVTQTADRGVQPWGVRREQLPNSNTEEVSNGSEIFRGQDYRSGGRE